MDYGYIREDRTGPGIEDQRATIACAGLTDARAIFIDRLPETGVRPKRLATANLVERNRLVETIGSGDRLVVSAMDRLGLSAGDILAAIARAVSVGASVYDVSADRSVDRGTPPDVLGAVVEQAQTQLYRQHMSAARGVLASGLVRRGRKPSLSVSDRPLAELDWHENHELTQTQVAKKWQVSVNTLRRAFGNR